MHKGHEFIDMGLDFLDTSSIKNANFRAFLHSARESHRLTPKEKQFFLGRNPWSAGLTTPPCPGKPALKSALVRIWPVLILILLVLGSIYLGIATPAEAAAVGCIGAFAMGNATE